MSEILDSITQLGQVRYAFPTHYFDAWETMFTDNTYSREMMVGIVVQVGLPRRGRHGGDRLVPP